MFRESVDLTLTPGATGKEVAEACVQKINSLVEFDNDFQLLKRIALVGSNFGENYTSGTADRGMWQVIKTGNFFAVWSNKNVW